LSARDTAAAIDKRRREARSLSGSDGASGIFRAAWGRVTI